MGTQHKGYMRFCLAQGAGPASSAQRVGAGARRKGSPRGMHIWVQGQRRRAARVGGAQPRARIQHRGAGRGVLSEAAWWSGCASLGMPSLPSSGEVLPDGHHRIGLRA